MTVKTRIEDEEEERTTETGFFNYAESYAKAASYLKAGELHTTHPDSVVSFLYYHAIELYLKSFLRLQAYSAKELRLKFGHRTCCLSEAAARAGLWYADEDIEVLSMIATTDAAIRSRYIQTGYFRVPSTEALERVCKSLRESVGAALRGKGILVRI